MPKTGPAGSNTSSILRGAAADREDPDRARSAPTPEHAPEDEEDEGAYADRDQALGDGCAGDAEQVDGLGFGGIDLAGTGFAGSRSRRGSRGRHRALERLLVGAAGMGRVAAAGGTQHVS